MSILLQKNINQSQIDYIISTKTKHFTIKHNNYIPNAYGGQIVESVIDLICVNKAKISVNPHNNTIIYIGFITDNNVDLSIKDLQISEIEKQILYTKVIEDFKNKIKIGGI